MDVLSCNVFDGIGKEERRCMCECLSGREQSFAAGTLMVDYAEMGNEIGILLSGRAEVVRIGREGECTLLEHLRPGEPFGYALYPAADVVGDAVTVRATEESQVLFLDYRRLLQRCERNCPHHVQMEQNLMRIIVHKARRLSERVEVLSRRTIRDKLLCYFAMQQGKCGENFTLPFSLSRLADYISADRSAMMRELKKMKEENLVTIDHRQVTLLKTLY